MRLRELLKYFTMADHPTLLDGGSFSRGSGISGNYLGPFTVAGSHLSKQGCLDNSNVPTIKTILPVFGCKVDSLNALQISMNIII